MWRIGSSGAVNIWNYPWIPLSPDRQVITPRGETILSSVNDLIDPSSGAWDDALITNIFNLMDVRRILQILLIYQAFDDFTAWYMNITGSSSV